MTDANKWKSGFYQGLQALADSSFPKQCNHCGEIYDSVEDFIKKTKHLKPEISGLKQSMDDDESVIVELYRNCECGSTLLDFFTDRRDMSDQGEDRRRQFGELLNKLTDSGLAEVIARVELIKILRGEVSEILEHIELTNSSE